MIRAVSDKNLFGKRIRIRRPRYEAALERGEKRTLPVRAGRVRWLATVMPIDMGFCMSLETYHVFEEAKASFVYGNFVASIVLAAAFVEHWIVANLDGLGYGREGSRGLSSAIKTARKANLVHQMLLDRVERLRLIRNPFVHLKAIDHEHNLDRRFLKQRVPPSELLEEDAKQALTTMYGIARHAFS